MGRNIVCHGVAEVLEIIAEADEEFPKLMVDKYGDKLLEFCTKFDEEMDNLPDEAILEILKQEVFEFFDKEFGVEQQ